MAVNIQSLSRAREKIESLQRSTARARKKAGEMMEDALTAAETSGAAFALGFWEGSITDPKQFEFFGVPAPLAIGLGAHAAAAFGVGRGMESHFKAIGNGALAAHLNGVGRVLGTRKKGASVRGELSGSSMRGVGVTAADLAALAV